MTQIPQEKSKNSRARLIVGLPVIVALVAVLGFVLLLAVPGSPLRLNKWELSIITDTITILVVLCPLVICMAPLYFLLVLTVYGVSKTHNGLNKALVRTQAMTTKAADKTTAVAETAARHSIGFNARFAFLSRFFSELGKPEGNDDHEPNPEAG